MAAYRSLGHSDLVELLELRDERILELESRLNDIIDASTLIQNDPVGE